ncbi:MAG: hypothetical protein H6Q89_5746, partial [Myxococcaceae bacterium]|nr:hypothetical protein [Myxococcaceae bacterium]
SGSVGGQRRAERRRVLHTRHTESGGRVETIAAPLTSLPPGLQALVLAAPIARTVTGEEVKALEKFVREGGTLVYLSPRPARAQPELQRWLALSDAPAPVPGSALLADLGGRTVDVDSALLPGVKQLRVASDTTLEVEAPDAVAIAGKALWVRPMGKGQVWIGAGADLAENRRLDLLDNQQLWANLRPLRIGFDEFHHGEAAAPRWSANLWASLLQFVFLGLLFVAARARRLGPARPTPAREHRSSLEYVRSIGALMRRAGVEGELKLALRDRLRRLMQERLGIAITLGADEASRILAAQTGIAPDAYLRLDQRLSRHGSGFAAAAAEAARIEDAVVGRHG